MGHVTRVNSPFRRTGDRIFAFQSSDVESDDYSESARSYELGKASDFACARPRPDFSAFLCLWRKVTIGWEMRPVRLVLQNIRNFFSQNEWCLPFTKIVGPVRAAIRRKVQVRKVREKPGGRLFTTFTDVLRPLTSLLETIRHMAISL